MFNLFKQFAQSSGKVNISRATKGPFDDINLGGWVSTQKGHKASGKLPKPKQEKLESILGWQ